MKKVCAMKILCAVLAIAMVLGTGVSAMAVTTYSTVVYNTDGTYNVTTEVEGLAEGGEMVTYMVHNASSMYAVTPANIDYIEQKTATGSTETFAYDGTGATGALAGYKIYVGAESLSAPVEGTATVIEGPAVELNGEPVVVAVDNYDVADDKVVKTIKLPAGTAATVTAVKIGDTAVEDYFVIGDYIGFATSTALTADNTVSITTGTNANLTGDVGIKLGTYNVDATSLVVLGRVSGAYTECGIGIYNDASADDPDTRFAALGVSGEGGFAVELKDETDGANLAGDFAGCRVYAYAEDANGELYQEWSENSL